MEHEVRVYNDSNELEKDIAEVFTTAACSRESRLVVRA